MGYVAYPDVFVEGVENYVTFYDEDGDKDLDGYKSASITYAQGSGRR